MSDLSRLFIKLLLGGAVVTLIYLICRILHRGGASFLVGIILSPLAHKKFAERAAQNEEQQETQQNGLYD